MPIPRVSRSIRLLIAALAIVGIVIWRHARAPEVGTTVSPAEAGDPVPGGRLVATVRSEPTTFDRLIGTGVADERLSLLTQGSLIRVNPETDALEPGLAREWSSSPDGRTWTLTLRDGLVYSDGVPFSSADVTFTFDALYDARVQSDVASAYLIGGKPLVVRATDAHTVTVTFPSTYGPGLRILDGLPIVPRHKLAAALAAGTLRDAWTMATRPAEVAGLGPFVVTEVTPGQRIRLSRNPHYWRIDDRGRALPYLDGIDLEIVPDQNAEVLRFEAGQSDLMNDFVRAEDIAALRDLAAKGSVRLIDAGVTVDPSALWFSLLPTAPAAKDRPWLLRDEFRLGLSSAIDRQAIVDTVYLGAAVPIAGPITPGFGDWYANGLAPPARDAARARALFASAGLVDKAHDGKFVDPSGASPHFSILTQKGNTARERTVALIQSQLAAFGFTVDVAAVDVHTLVHHVMQGDYDAMYYGPLAGSRDPAENLDFWMSSGAFHFWHPAAATPATPWEAQIDDLMRRQGSSLDVAERHRLFHDVQRVFADHAPALYFAAANATVGISRRLQGVRAAVLQPSVLWNVDRLWLAGR